MNGALQKPCDTQNERYTKWESGTSRGSSTEPSYQHGPTGGKARGGDSATVGPSQGHITSSRALREPGIGRNIIPPSLWRLAGTASVLTFRQDYEHDIDREKWVSVDREHN